MYSSKFQNLLILPHKMAFVSIFLHRTFQYFLTHNYLWIFHIIFFGLFFFALSSLTFQPYRIFCRIIFTDRNCCHHFRKLISGIPWYLLFGEVFATFKCHFDRVHEQKHKVASMEEEIEKLKKQIGEFEKLTK